MNKSNHSSSSSEGHPSKELKRKSSFQEENSKTPKTTLNSEFNMGARRLNTQSTFLNQARSGNLSLFESSRMPLGSESFGGMSNTMSLMNVRIPEFSKQIFSFSLKSSVQISLNSSMSKQ